MGFLEIGCRDLLFLTRERIELEESHRFPPVEQRLMFQEYNRFLRLLDLQNYQHLLLWIF